MILILLHAHGLQRAGGPQGSNTNNRCILMIMMIIVVVIMIIIMNVYIYIYIERERDIGPGLSSIQHVCIDA